MATATVPESTSPSRSAANGLVASLAAVLTVMVGWGVFGLHDREAGGSEDSFSALQTTAPAPATSPATSPVAPVVPAAGETATTAAPVATDPPTTPAPAPAVDHGRTPTPTDKLKVYIAGDSDAGNMGPPLQQELEKTGLVTSELFYKVSSGLSRPDFFDWPARLQKDMASINPDIVIVTFGGNDAQDIKVGGQFYPVSTPEWQAEYSKRVGLVMDFLSADKRKLVWVGIPNAEEEKFRQRLQVLEQVTRAEAAKRPQVDYFATWDKFVGPSGGYASHYFDPRDGTGKKVRAGDGFHLNVAGAEILAWYVKDNVIAELARRGAKV